MKKSLLLSLAVAVSATAAMADVKTPTVYDGASFQRMSADGRYAVSEYYGVVTIYDLVDNTDQSFFPDADDINSYSIGLGNCFTPDGKILLGSTTENGTASYLKDGVWYDLNVSDEEMSNSANGITPDGSRICGSIGLNAMTFDDVIMMAPAYWDRNGEGYGKYNVLPYPKEDFFGDKPQYVTAVNISNDGKTIIGQMTFGSGAMIIPIVYTQNDKGEWSYNLPTKDLFNPDGIEPVENPGEGPAQPTQEDFMTPEELEAYLTAYQNFWDNYPDVNWDEYPTYDMFMTEEEYDAFLAAMDEYYAIYDEWAEKYDAFWDYQSQVLAASPNFLFNNVYLSTDNKKIVTTLIKEVADPEYWWRTEEIYTPCTIDLATSALDTIDTDTSIIVCGTADNGVILGCTNIWETPMVGYIITDGNIQTVADYISTKSPELGTWISENMKHEVVVGWEYDEVEDDYIDIYDELLFVGMPIATPDLSKIAVWTMAEWSESYVEGTVFDLTSTSGIATIAAGAKDLKLDADGSIVVPAGFASLEVYNVSGTCVKAVAEPVGNIDLNLGNGVYIAKGTRNDGSVSVIKVSK